MRLRRPPGGPPTTSSRPADSGTSPRTALIIVDLPAPFGPSTATNSPAGTVTSTPLQITRLPARTAASSNRTTAGGTSTGPRFDSADRASAGTGLDTAAI